MATRVIKTPADYAAAHKAIQDRLDKIAEGGKKALTKAVTDVAIDIISRAVERAPVCDGDLRGSGYANVNGDLVAKGRDDQSGGTDIVGTPGEPAGNIIVAEIGFSEEKYAFVQHEHLEFNHPIGGQAKYLESVIVENEDRYMKLLADSAKKGLRGDDV